MTNTISIYGRYRFLSDIPRIASSGVPEGTFVTIGHDGKPASGDVLYAARIPWRRLSGYFIQGAYDTFPFDSRPTTVNAIVAVLLDGSWVLFAPIYVRGVLMYDYNSPYGTISSSLGNALNMPNVVPPNGSVVLYDYDYSSLVNSANEGETAWYGNASYIYSAGSWNMVDSVLSRAKMIINGEWKQVSPSLVGFSEGSGTMMYVLPSEAKPNFFGFNIGDEAFHFDDEGKPTVEWTWTGSDWVKIPLVQYIDQLGARNADIDFAVIRQLATQQLKANVISSGDNVGPHSGGQGYVLNMDGMNMYDKDGNSTVNLDASSGVATLRGARIINGQVVVSGANGTSALDDQGFEYKDAQGNVLVQIGHGIPTGMGVRDPRSGQVVPLSNMVFGGSFVKSDSIRYTPNVSVSQYSSSWTTWRHFKNEDNTFFTPTGKMLFAFTGLSGFSSLYSFMNIKIIFSLSPNNQSDSNSFNNALGEISGQYSVPYMSGLENGVSVIDEISSLPANQEIYVHIAIRAYCSNDNSSAQNMSGFLNRFTIWGIPA